MLFWLRDNAFNPIVLGNLEKTLIDKIEDNLGISASMDNQLEKCALCEDPVPFSSIKIATCSRNHTFTRCSQTMLMIPSSGNYICYGCRGIVFKEVLDFWWLPVKPFRCSFCNSIIRHFIEF